MMLTHRRQVVNCPHCGLENPASESTCRACSKSLTIYIGPAHNRPRRFGLGSLMVLVAVTAPGLALLREVPVLGVLILVLLPAAVVRTSAAAYQCDADLRPMSTDHKLWTFLGSVGLMIAVLVSTFLLFFVVFITAGAIIGFEGLPFAIALGALAALTLGYRMLRSLWPYKG
jgi:hypothetical protein